MRRAYLRIMPPRAAPPNVHGPLTRGAGMTAGLELWRVGATYVLVDRSADGRFANDVATWNAAAGLKPAALKHLKDATAAQ